jgi:hypothetical protein
MSASGESYPVDPNVAGVFAEIGAESKLLTWWERERMKIGMKHFPYSLDDQLLPHPDQGTDGRLYIANTTEAVAVASNNPVAGRRAKNFVDSALLVERQQLGISREDAQQVGDYNTYGQLMQDERLLNTVRANELNFWAVVSTLHPISATYQREHAHDGWLPPGICDDWAIQAKRLMLMHRELLRLSDELTGPYGIHDITLWQDHFAKDPMTAERVSGATDFAELFDEHFGAGMVNLRRLFIIRRILSDVISGEASNTEITHSRVARIAMRALTQEEEARSRFKSLRSLDGVNPAQCALANRLSELPKCGWLIEAQIGQNSGITVYRFEKPGDISYYGFGDPTSDRVHLWLTLLRSGFASYRVSYQHPDQVMDYTGLTPSLPQETVPLSDGNVLRGNVRLMRIYEPSNERVFLPAHGRADFTLQCDLAERQSQPLTIYRITDDTQPLFRIIPKFGLAMGMRPEDASLLTDMFRQKEAHRWARPETLDEQQKREAAESAYLNAD